MVGPFEIALILTFGFFVIAPVVFGIVLRMRRAAKPNTSGSVLPASEEIPALRNEIERMKEQLAELTLALDEMQRREGHSSARR